MLKKIRGLFLGLVVLAGSACVTPTHASSAQSVVLSYVQAAGPTGAREELVVLHNNTGVEVDLTDWCVTNKTGLPFACFVPPVIDAQGGVTHFILPAYGDATIASNDYLSAHMLITAAVSSNYEVTNQSSGSMVGSSDVVNLIDDNGEVVDQKSWSSAPPSGKAWARVKVFASPDIYASENDASDWISVGLLDLPQNNVELRVVPGEQSGTDPEGTSGGESDPEEGAPAVSTMMITEVFANAVGVDTGNEFIELFNPDPLLEQSLDGLRVSIGLTTPKWYSFPTGITVQPRKYIVFTDKDLGFTLVNTNGSVQLYQDAAPLGSRIDYAPPKEGESWAYIDGIWQYTAIPTPGSENLPTPVESAKTDAVITASSKPCADNQFRNPDTGRCKLLSAAAKVATPCKAGQERNPETNRCRTVATTSAPTPCKEGQERNVDTNRCRNVTKLTPAQYGVKGVEKKAGAQLQWYYWVAIAAVVILILTYAVWEWREELLTVWRRISRKFARS